MPCQAGHYISDEEALEACKIKVPMTKREKYLVRIGLITGTVLGFIIGAGFINALWLLF